MSAETGLKVKTKTEGEVIVPWAVVDSGIETGTARVGDVIFENQRISKSRVGSPGRERILTEPR
jgi:hypothetical protein